MTRSSAPAVIDGQLRHVSASQIETFEDCPRRWYLDKVLGLAMPPSAAQARGVAIHKELEDWYEDGTPVSDTVKPALAYLPNRAPHLLTELALADPPLLIND